MNAEQIARILCDDFTAATGQSHVPAEVPCAMHRRLATPVAQAGDAAWKRGRWWRIVLADGELWMETSDEHEAREELDEIKAAGARLQRDWRSIREEWRDVS